MVHVFTWNSYIDTTASASRVVLNIKVSYSANIVSPSVKTSVFSYTTVSSRQIDSVRIECSGIYIDILHTCSISGAAFQPPNMNQTENWGTLILINFCCCFVLFGGGVCVCVCLFSLLDKTLSFTVETKNLIQR